MNHVSSRRTSSKYLWPTPESRTFLPISTDIPILHSVSTASALALETFPITSTDDLQQFLTAQSTVWQLPNFISWDYTTSSSSSTRGFRCRRRQSRRGTISCIHSPSPAHACPLDTYIGSWSTTRCWTLIISSQSSSIPSSTNLDESYGYDSTFK